MNATIIDADGCLRLDITSLIGSMTDEQRAYIIQSLACCTQVIDEVMNQVIDGSTTEGWYGIKGLGGDPDARSGIDGARMRIAKASSDIAAEEIKRLADELERSRERESAAREQAQAERLWPMQPMRQEKWLQAIATVRATTNGWVLDSPLAKEQCNAHD